MMNGIFVLSILNLFANITDIWLNWAGQNISTFIAV